MSRTMSLYRRAAWKVGLASFAGAAVLAGCVSENPTAPAMLRPDGADFQPSGQPMPLIDLTAPGAVARGMADVEIIDTRLMPQIGDINPWPGPVRRVREALPTHGKTPIQGDGIPNQLPVGGVMEEERAIPGELWPAIGQTPWTPPDPTLAVGPNHVVATVNMDIAFYTKAGVQQFISRLDNTGSPGFFETVGGGNFTFDPKCFYDHLAQRFVVVALETYGSTESWVDIAVSDDSDPNGTWYKYRTNSVVTVGGNTYWVDYPGFGYDANAYYVSGNLFGLNNGGFGGVFFRVFNKTPLLSGQPAVFSTLRDGNGASAQACQHFGSNQAPYFVSTATSTSLRVYAITNPIVNPQLVQTTVTVPSYSGPGSAPAAGGQSVSLVDARIFNCQWRDGNLYATHNITTGGKNQARWYHMNTNNWPTSGSVSLTQSGNVDGGSGVHTYFPAIYSNQFDDVGMVIGASSSTTRISVNVTGRKATDPTGQMGAITQLFLSPVNGGGRWGDYYDIAVDPVDDSRFWIIGEYANSGGWGTWVGDFTITADGVPAVTISAPADGSVFSEADSVAFSGSATDPEDGNVTASLQWSSSLDGAIGLGASFNTSSLSVGTHTITATAFDSGGQPGSESIDVTIEALPSPPADPTGLVVLEGDAADSFIYWVDNANNETAYEIQRQTRQGNSWGQLFTINLPADSANHIDAAGPGGFRYRVRASNAGGQSNFTAYVIRAPKAPSNVTAVNNAGVITIGWTDNSLIEDGHTVQRQKRINGTWQQSTNLPDVGANVTSTTDSPGSGTWRYRVRANNVGKNSSWSPWRQIVVP